jgi:hypothetical protein
MELESSSPYPQVPATCPYPETTPFNPRRPPPTSWRKYVLRNIIHNFNDFVIKNCTPNTVLSRFSLAHILTPYASNLRFNIIPKRSYNTVASVPLHAPLTCACKYAYLYIWQIEAVEWEANFMDRLLIRIRATRLDDVHAVRLLVTAWQWRTGSCWHVRNRIINGVRDCRHAVCCLRGLNSDVLTA